MSERFQRFESRQTMANKTFEVFHYRDKKTPFVGVHHHDFYELYFFLGGKVEFQVEGKNFPMKPGDLLLINPRELHRVTSQPDTVYERIVLWINRDYLAALGGDSLELTACFDSQAPNHLCPSKLQRAELGNMLERLAAEYYGTDMGGDLYARGLLLQFLVEVNRLALQAAPATLPPPEQDLVGQVTAYIGDHYAEGITLEGLAEQFFVSKYHLSHEFSRRMGMGVYRYVQFRRLLQARELLVAGQPPGDVYQTCGFGDYANFYRAFKAEYGVSPRAFQKPAAGTVSG